MTPFTVRSHLVNFHLRWAGKNKRLCDNAQTAMKLSDQRNVAASFIPFILLLPQVSNAEK